MLVGIIMGGTSSEREVSFLTGNTILENIDKEKYEVLPVPVNTKFELIDKVRNLDFAFIALHGKFGEDGMVQSILESMNIPYSGSGVLSSALCMDKDVSKKIMVSEGINTPKWVIVHSIDDFKNEVICKKISLIQYPLVVKPNSGGSSIGITIVNDYKELLNATSEALKLDCEVMIEEFIKGDEITCCLLNGELLPILSIKPRNSFFDYESKYTDQGAIESILFLPKDIKDKVDEICKKCWVTFKCKAYSRIDIIIKNGNPYVLELNSLSGLTKNSLFPKSAAACGLNFSELIDLIIKYSLNE